MARRRAREEEGWRSEEEVKRRLTEGIREEHR